MHQLNWEHLRYLLAVSSEGSIAAAARKLKVNRSTVLRRINQFQDEVQCTLFVRSDSGYSLTPEAEQMIAVAQDVEINLLAVQRKIAGKELKLEGDLHITTTDSVMDSLLARYLNGFLKVHPNIVLHLHVTPQVLDLSRRDADIAIRPTIAPPDHLIGKKLCDLKFHIYASKRYLKQQKKCDWKQLKWIGFDQHFQKSPPITWVESHVDKNQFIMFCDTFVAIKIAIENDIGIGLLPDYLGNASKNLELIATPEINENIGLWVLTHPDLMRSAKVHAFYKYFKAAFDT